MGLYEDRFLRKKTPLPKPQVAPAAVIRPWCDCLPLGDDGRGFKHVQDLTFHGDVQNTACEAWKTLEALIEKAVADGSGEFAPLREMSPEMRSQIVTLPASIAKLKSVHKLYLYGSHLVRIPPEIGQMQNLEELDIYTSYRLHWLPYEVTWCKKITSSRASTRALYGNYKFRPPFPRLVCEEAKVVPIPKFCSICRRELDPGAVRQVWISLRVGLDVFPLVVNACSNDCVGNLPSPANSYVNYPHTGGLELQQPEKSLARPKN